MNDKEKLTLILKTAPLPLIVNISLDFLGDYSVIDLLDFDDEIFELFLTTIAQPTKDEGIRDMSALATEILSTVLELRKRTISLANEAEVSMKKLLNQES